MSGAGESSPTPQPLQSTAPSPPQPSNWPASIIYLSKPQHSSNLSPEQIEQLTTRPSNGTTSGFSHVVQLPLTRPSHVEIRQMNDPSHPAHTQHGLFATRHLPPSTLIVPYLGQVHSNAAHDTDSDSNYDLSLDRDIALSVDANKCGNEARMINDYRGVPRPAYELARLKKKGDKLGPNAEFCDLWFISEDGTGGERGIGIFVLTPGKSGRWKEGILAGEEILVNYGKGFWKERNDRDRE